MCKFTMHLTVLYILFDDLDNIFVLEDMFFADLLRIVFDG